MRRGGEAEVARQALRDLAPRLAGVVGAMHPDVVLLVHALRVGRADELVHAEADLFVLGRPVAAQPAVPRRPRRTAVLGLERADALHDREEPVGVAGLGDEARDPEVPGRLVGGIVPTLAPRLAGESRQQRPGLPVVAALEDSRRLDADEQAVAGSCERRHLRDLAPVLVAVGEALARHLPRLAEIRAAPDGGAVPLARSGRIDRAGGRVVDGVVDGPPFAERAAERPLPAVVALEQECALAGSNGQHCLRHRCSPQRSRDSRECRRSGDSGEETPRPSKTHRSGRPRSRSRFSRRAALQSPPASSVR